MSFDNDEMVLRLSNESNDDEFISDRKYLFGIAKAEQDLALLIDKIRNKEYKDSDYIWVGADIAINKEAAPRSADWWPPQDDYVVTPFCKELSWVFIQLRDIFYEEPLIDSLSKYEFFSRLANAAINYMGSTSDGVGKKEELLMATHHEAEIILKEMLELFPHSD
mgnify:FL=1